MNYYGFLLSLIYKAREINLEEQKFQIKPRPEWKKSAVCFLSGTILSLLVFLLISRNLISLLFFCNLLVSYSLFRP